MNNNTTKHIFSAIAIGTIFFLQGCSEKIDANQIKEVNGFYYKSNQNDRFTGTIINYLGNCDLQVKKGQLDGKMSCKWNDGAPMFDREYLNGKKDGSYQVWDKKGQMVKSRSMWKDDLMNGVDETFNDLGKLTHQITWSNGKENGQEKRWSESGEKLIYQANWSAGQKIGVEKEWDKTGEKLIMEFNWIDGKQTGFDNRKNQEFTLKNGLLDGKTKIFGIASSGKQYLNLETNYINGKMEGKQTGWNEFGNELLRRVYKDDIIQSETKQSWYKEKIETIKSSINVAGLGLVKDGVEKKWDENGILKFEATWEKGIALSMYERGLDGQMNKIEPYDTESIRSEYSSAINVTQPSN